MSIAVPTGDLAQFDAVALGGIISDQLINGSASLRLQLGFFSASRIFEQGSDLIESDGRFGRVNNGFNFRFKAHIKGVSD